MANDPPTNLRMGFGFKQARAAGLDGIRTPRSPRQVNRLVKENKATREATEALRDEMRKDPDWRNLIEHRINQGCNAQEIWDEIYWIKLYARKKARGYPLAYRLRFYWPY